MWWRLFKDVLCMLHSVAFMVGRTRVVSSDEVRKFSQRQLFSGRTCVHHLQTVILTEYSREQQVSQQDLSIFIGWRRLKYCKKYCKKVEVFPLNLMQMVNLYVYCFLLILLCWFGFTTCLVCHDRLSFFYSEAPFSLFSEKCYMNKHLLTTQFNKKLGHYVKKSLSSNTFLRGKKMYLCHFGILTL